CVEARLVERNFAACQFRQLAGVDVDTEHVVTQLRHARGMGGPQVTRSEHRNTATHVRLLSAEGGPLSWLGTDMLLDLHVRCKFKKNKELSVRPAVRRWNASLPGLNAGAGDRCRRS